MKSPVGKALFLLISAAALLLAWQACTNIEDSPEPGILRVTLQADPTDTLIVIIGDTFVVSEKDQFIVTVFQGRVFRDSLFADLFETLTSYRQADIAYNLFKRDEQNQYTRYVLFETYVPPGPYNQLEFGLTPSLVKLKAFQIPVRLPEGSSLLVQLQHEFEVRENGITEVNIQLKPLQSLVRYRDSYIFQRQLQIVSVNYF